MLDASVTIAALIEEERSEEARSIISEVIAEGAIVPVLWFLEVVNVLLLAERRRKLSAVARREHLADLSCLPIAADPETASQAWHRTLALAEQHGLSAYDAAYLELSLRRQLPLATFDTELRRAARMEDVRLL